MLHAQDHYFGLSKKTQRTPTRGYSLQSPQMQLPHLFLVPLLFPSPPAFNISQCSPVLQKQKKRPIKNASRRNTTASQLTKTACQIVHLRPHHFMVLKRNCGLPFNACQLSWTPAFTTCRCVYMHDLVIEILTRAVPPLPFV